MFTFNIVVAAYLSSDSPHMRFIHADCGAHFHPNILFLHKITPPGD